MNKHINRKLLRVVAVAMLSGILIGCASTKKQFEAPANNHHNSEASIRAQIKFITDRLKARVEALIAKGKFDAARDAIWSEPVSPIAAIAAEVEPFKDRLLRERVNVVQYVQMTNRMERTISSHLAKKEFDEARRYLESIVPVRLYVREIDAALQSVGTALTDVSVPQETADKAVEAARPLLEELFADDLLRIDRVPAGSGFKPNRKGYEEKLSAFRRALLNQGCPEADAAKAVAAVSAVADPALRSIWRPLRDEEVAPPAAIGTSRLNALVAAFRDELYRNKVVPAQIAARAKELRGKVLPLLEKDDPAAARLEIFRFGMTGFPEVDDPIFAVKLGLLNGRANRAVLVRARKRLVAAVDAALTANDIPAALAAIGALGDAPAYAPEVTGALQSAARSAVALRVPEGGAKGIVEDAEADLYGRLAPRPDPVREERIIQAYLDEISGIARARDATEPDWSEVRRSLETAADWLVKDDVSREEADAMTDEIIEAFRALLAAPGFDRGVGRALTTEQLNRALASLRAEQFARVAATLAKINGANAADIAAKAALDVDFDARIDAFVNAIGDRTEPDVNRILGDGARILRRHRMGADIPKGDVTSLFVASVYMGFDDVARLALALGADVNGPSPKDNLARPAFLLAMQYGYRGSAEELLRSADRSVRDARGQGAVHYAVRGCNGLALSDLIRSGADAGTADVEGTTPIMLAASLGHAGMVRALIPFSDPGQADRRGFTALLLAARKGRTDIVRMLVAAKADLGAKTDSGDGALELAAMANSEELLAYLLDEKKIVPTPRVVSQLVIAGNVPTLQTMVSRGAALQDAHLAVAVKRGHFPMVKYLVNLGLDVNAEVVQAATGGESGSSGVNDGAYYGPEGESIRAFLQGQGQRP